MVYLECEKSETHRMAHKRTMTVTYATAIQVISTKRR